MREGFVISSEELETSFSGISRFVVRRESSRGLHWTEDKIRQWIQGVGRKLCSRMRYSGHGGNG